MSYKMNIDDVDNNQLNKLKDKLHSGKKTNPEQDNILWRLIIMELEKRKNK